MTEPDAEQPSSSPPSTAGGTRPRRGWTRPLVIFLAVSTLLVAALLWWASEVLLPFVLSIIIAYVLTPLVAACERLRLPRVPAILVVYLVVLGGLYLAVAGVAPRLYQETVKLARDTPAMAEGASRAWGPAIDNWVAGLRRGVGPHQVDDSEPAPHSASLEVRPRPEGGFDVHLGSGIEIVQLSQERWQLVPSGDDGPDRFSVTQWMREGVGRFIHYVERNALQLLRFGQSLIAGVARGIFMLFMTLMVAGYLIHTREQVIGFFRSLVPPSAGKSFDGLLWRIDRGLSGVIRGQLLICLVNGILSAIGFWLFDLKYWPILALAAGMMSLIPIFGSILSTVPAVIIGLTQDVWTALWVLIWIVGIHQIEANLLNPKIIGVSARIHPVLVVFALIVGEHFYGLWGALLAVPTWSVLQSVFKHFRFEEVATPAERARLPASERPPVSPKGAAPGA